MPRPRRRELTVVALAVLAFAVLLTFALARLVEIERTTHSSSGEGIVWALSQTQYEIHRLLLATLPDRPASADAIALRFDVLLSRLDLLQTGPMATQLAQAGRVSVVSRARTALLQFEPMIASGTDVTRYGARLARVMGQFLEPLGTIANDVMINNRIADGERRNSYNSSIAQVIVSILGIMVTGGFLIFRLVRSLGQAATAEALVRQEKTFLGQIMGASGEGIAAFDTTLSCTHWNEGMTRLLHAPTGERLGQSLVGAHTALTAERLKEVLAGEEVYLAPVLGDDGAYLEWSLYPIRLNAAVNGGIVIVRDVTERYDAQRERQLREVYRDFVAMVSHQFRTPLAVIDSTVHRMMRRGPLMDATEFSGRSMTIRNAVADLSRLMDSTLTAERIDAGEMDVSLRNTDMEQLLRAIQARFLDLFPERSITLDMAPLDTLECDAMLIDQAVGNLVGNALKYSPADQPVELSAAMDGASIRVVVADHGVGIPEAEQPRLFERFFRASTATTVSGSGIGLYTARQIARLHRGDIIVTSGPKGTVFTLILPRQHSETP